MPRPKRARPPEEDGGSEASRQRRGVRWQASARHRCRVPEGALWPQRVLPAPDSGVAGAGLRHAPLPPHSTTLPRDAGVLAEVPRSGESVPPEGALWPQRVLSAPDSGVAGVGLRHAPLPPHSTTLPRDAGVLAEVPRSGESVPPEGALWPQRVLSAPESGVAGAGLRSAPLPPHSTTLPRTFPALAFPSAHRLYSSFVIRHSSFVLHPSPSRHPMSLRGLP